VKFGQEKIQDDKLKFYFSIQECLAENKPNVVLLSSVLQYLKDPYSWWRECLSLNIPYIIVDRTAFNLNGRQVLVVQNVPQEIYEASYPAWFFNLTEFKKYFQDSYSIVATFDSSFEKPVDINEDVKGVWKGFILKKK
jgi:putative methyltransferase (TIGR04325 family)